MKQRLLQFIERTGLKRAQFEKACGLSNGYIKNMRSALGPQKLEGVLKAFPELSRVWLLTGEGEMLIDSPVHHNTITIDASGDSNTASSENGVALAGSNAQYNASGDADAIKRLEAENESLKAQLKEKDAQIASLHTILANITNK